MSKRLPPSFSFFQFFIEFDAVASQEQQEPDPSMKIEEQDSDELDD